MTAFTADILCRFIHARNYKYRIWATMWCEPIFGYVGKVTKDKVVIDDVTYAIATITGVTPFYGSIKWKDELDD